MFEGKFLQVGIFKKVLEAIKDLVTDSNFSCSPSGLSLQAMDSSHVALVTLLIKENGFEHYKCDFNMNIGLNLINMSKMLKNALNEDTMTIKANPEDPYVLFIVENPEEKRYSKFELCQMEIDCENLKILETKYKATVQMPSHEFQKIVRDLNMIGEQIQISVSKNKVTFSTVGDIGKGEITLNSRNSEDDTSNDVTVDVNEAVSLPFAGKYLNTFAKASPISPLVNIKLSQNCPIVIEFPIEQIGHIKYYLAPKINDDDDDSGDETQSENSEIE